MSRYIDADKLLEYLEKEAESEDVKYSFIGAGVQATINEIKKFPMEDVKPVIHARWIDACDGWHTICSNCGEKYYDDLPRIAKCCPHCGAKMDEE